MVVPDEVRRINIKLERTQPRRVEVLLPAGTRFAPPEELVSTALNGERHYYFRRTLVILPSTPDDASWLPPRICLHMEPASDGNGICYADGFVELVGRGIAKDIGFALLHDRFDIPLSMPIMWVANVLKQLEQSLTWPETLRQPHAPHD